MKKTSKLVHCCVLLTVLSIVGGNPAAGDGAGLGATAAKALPGSFPDLLLPASPGAAASTAPCVADAETLCLLGGEIEIRVRFRNQRAGGQEEVGKAASLRERTGAFWFFREDNLEVIVKALDGRANNGHFWIFLASLSDLEFWVDARATSNGATATYYNPPGNLYGLADTRALGETEGELCGTIQGLTCPEGFFCELEGSCSVEDAAGVCVLVGDGCTEEFDPVCGCDGVTYSNDCVRRRAGVQKDHDGPCV